MDTFMFKVTNKKTQIKNSKIFKKLRPGIKNVPDAIRWHFASYWTHAISKGEIKSISNSKKLIEKYMQFNFFEIKQTIL